MWFTKNWFGLGLFSAIIILGFTTFGNPSTKVTTVPAQIEHQSTCSANLVVCDNEEASTPGPKGTIKANTNDHPVVGSPAYDRILIIFHWEYMPEYHLAYCIDGWCPVVKAAAGGAYIGGGGAYYCPTNCYLKVANNDPYDPSFSLWQWWSARERKDGTLYDELTGRPSL